MPVCFVRLLETLDVGPAEGSSPSLPFPIPRFSSVSCRIAICRCSSNYTLFLPPSLPAPIKRTSVPCFSLRNRTLSSSAFHVWISFFCWYKKKISSLKHSWPRFEGLCPVRSLQSSPIWTPQSRPTAGSWFCKNWSRILDRAFLDYSQRNGITLFVCRVVFVWTLEFIDNCISKNLRSKPYTLLDTQNSSTCNNSIALHNSRRTRSGISVFLYSILGLFSSDSVRFFFCCCWTRRRV